MHNQNILTLPFPKQKNGRLHWAGLHGAAKSLAILEAAKQSNKMTLVITPDNQIVNQLEAELHFFNDQHSLPILTYPDWETLPYDTFSPHQDIISERIKTLNQLGTLKHGILLISITTLMHRTIPPEFIRQYAFVLQEKQLIDLNTFQQELVKNGYHHVEQVFEHGEFALRGSIIDLFPMSSNCPFRIDLFDNEIDTIRTFDPQTQRSIEKVNALNLYPAHEFPFTEEAIELFRNQWRENFSGNPIYCPLYQDISDSNDSPGIEYYFPLFFEKTATLFDHLPEEITIIYFENIQEKAKLFNEEISERYEQLRHDLHRPILSPEKLFISDQNLAEKINQFTRLCIHSNENSNEKTGTVLFNTQSIPNVTIDHKSKQPLKLLHDFLINNNDYKILFCVETLGRRETITDLLSSIKITPTKIESWQSFLTSDHKISIAIAPLEFGFLLPELKIALITENQLFGQRILQRRRRQKIQQDTENVIRNLTELHIGDPVVHIDHGIGRFLGLQTIKVDNQLDEYLTLEYANNTKLYVPVASLNLVSRYCGGEVEQVPLNTLGSGQWEKAKRKAAEQIRDVAAELLEIYAKRAARKGYLFPMPKQQYLAFSEAFPFEETPDQETAIQQVMDDMVSSKPMDRLICGDVGFGKTEVAMRAAFIAVHDNKQVAVLVPTTLLAQQHYENFKDRFADWPISIEMLSRFRSKKEQDKISEKLKEGKIDIVIGTHKLIQDDILFKNLGLLIIDEEHRFGVRQKEKLKAMRAHVDILTLTATPIPRTLNMAFSGIRDLSIIATPPEKRLSIKTFIQEKNDQRIREAILREIMRGGQVYYLHNDVKTIENCSEHLQTLIPEARIGVAHGQMRERDLERVMADFYHRKFNVLICSTIIETGIDIPSANTIIIERADKFGLAQLHQLRGRVGRSHRQAYAYLLIPSKENISRDAKKRLEAIESLEDLGAGFTLATHDMEIRGAGELLGEEQSGNMQEIGFTLYMEMLERAVTALKKGEKIDLEKPFESDIEIDLHIPALIPDIYLPDTHQRLILYKRISSAESNDALEELRVEMIDRFGLLPDPTKNLFQIAELKLIASRLGIKKIDVDDKFARFEFREKTNIDPMIIIQLIQTQPDKFQLQGPTKLRVKSESNSNQTKIDFVRDILKNFL